MFHKLLRYHFVRFVVVALALAFGVLAAAASADRSWSRILIGLLRMTSS